MLHPTILHTGSYDPARSDCVQSFIPRAEETWHLPAEITKAGAISTMCTWARLAGVSAIEIAAYRLIADTTDRAAWSGGPLPPMNWRRQCDMAREMGVSERHWRRIEARLEEMGLIARMTADNGYRGYRKGGTWAHPLRAGLSLAPSLANYAAFTAELAQAAAEEEQRQMHILNARTARRRLGLLIATLTDREVKAWAGGELEALTADLRPSTLRSADADALVAWHAGLLGLEDRIRDALVPLVPTQEPEDGPEERPETPCPAPSPADTAASDPVSGPAEPVDHDHPEGSDSPPIEKQQKMSAAPDSQGRGQVQPELNSNSLCNTPDLVPDMSKRPPANAGDCDLVGSPPYGGDHCFESKYAGASDILNPSVAEKLDRGGVRALASDDLGLYLDALEDWNEAIPFVLRELGINVSAWFDACEVMGEALAFLSLVVIDRNRFHPEAPVLSPGGALRAFTERAKSGELNLTRAVIGIWERERQGRQPKSVPRTERLV